MFQSFISNILNYKSEHKIKTRKKRKTRKIKKSKKGGYRYKKKSKKR